MARRTKSLSLVKGRRLRTTRLDGCGRPVYGDASVGVTKGFISAAFTANTTSTDEINVTNAGGESCIYEASVTQFAGFSTEIVFCDVDPDILSLITGQDVVLGHDGETVIGFDIDTDIELTSSGFALELWAGVPSGDACTTAGSQTQLGYILFPFLQGGILGDFTLENGAVSFTITGAQTKRGSAWGVGPYNVMTDEAGNPAKMPSPVKVSTAMRLIEVDLFAPDAHVGARPLMDPSVTALTSIAATITGLEADFNVVPDPAEDAAVWYDFGDDTWDYVVSEDGGTTHTYAEAGTYTAKATSDGEVWVSTQVTVVAP